VEESSDRDDLRGNRIGWGQNMSWSVRLYHPHSFPLACLIFSIILCRWCASCQASTFDWALDSIHLIEDTSGRIKYYSERRRDCKVRVY
jgi:hypothetical protein